MSNLLQFFYDSFSNFVDLLNNFNIIADFSILDLLIIIFLFNVVMKFLLIK